MLEGEWDAARSRVNGGCLASCKGGPLRYRRRLLRRGLMPRRMSSAWTRVANACGGRWAWRWTWSMRRASPRPSMLSREAKPRGIRRCGRRTRRPGRRHPRECGGGPGPDRQDAGGRLDRAHSGCRLRRLVLGLSRRRRDAHSVMKFHRPETPHPLSAAPTFTKIKFPISKIKFPISHTGGAFGLRNGL